MAGGGSEHLADCLRRARDGDRGAIGEAVGQLNPLLWHVARAQGLDAEEAADVVQTSWLELLRRLHEIRSPKALASWLVTTTRREAMRAHQRQRRLSPAMDLEVIPDPTSDLDERVSAREQRSVLWRQFSLLSERCRELLRIVAEVDRPDYDLVADALDMPRGSIGPTRGRCLAKLRQLLLADPAWSRG